MKTVVPRKKWTFSEFPDALKLIPEPPHGHVVCHIGANHGQEMEWYDEAGVDGVLLVEPDPVIAKELLERFPYVAVLAVACGETYGIAVLNQSIDDQFASLIEPGRDRSGAVMVPVLPTRVVQADANILVIDTQGTEMDVLSSVKWTYLDMFIIETSLIRNGYAVHRDILIPHMAERGFVPAVEWRHEDDGSYVDMVFIRGTHVVQD